MSLKHFHLVFVNAALLLAGWFCWWSWGEYRAEGDPAQLVYAIGAGIAGLALLAYEVWFLRKLARLRIE